MAVGTVAGGATMEAVLPPGRLSADYSQRLTITAPVLIIIPDPLTMDRRRRAMLATACGVFDLTIRGQAPI